MDYYHNNGGRYNPDQFRSGVQRQQQEWPSYGYAVSHRLGNGQHSAPVGSYEHQAVVPAHTTTHQQQQENYHAEHYRYNMTRQQQQLGEQPYQSISRPEHVLEACGQPQLNEPAGDSRSHPVHSQQQPQPQKRRHEECESNLLENGDSAKKIRKTENDAPLTQTSEARTSKLEGSKQKVTGTKAKTKAKIKVDGEQSHNEGGNMRVDSAQGPRDLCMDSIRERARRPVAVPRKKRSEKFLEVALLMPGYSQCTG
ncbi:hypothetical protein F4604DRAFT_1907304 [Suillus subluteus]|nr:hypothetical protein F4604DRAFT_1907304 [Suillus subluteus]